MRYQAILSTLVLATSGAIASPRDASWRVYATDLSLKRLSEAEIRSDSVTGYDERGVTVRIPLSDTFAVRFPGAAEPVVYQELSGDLFYLHLSDGQRIPVTVSDRTLLDTIVMDSPLFEGTVNASLESVRVLSRRAERLGPPGTDDTVTLVNGDTLSGFIVSVTDALEIETDSGITQLALDQVERVELVNDPTNPARTYLLLGDGSALRASNLDIPIAGNISFEVESHTTSRTLRAQEVDGVRLVHPLSWMVPLADLSASVSPSGEGRVWTPAPKIIERVGHLIQLRDIEIPAPARLVYTLEEQTTRFASEIEMIAGTWSGCELIVSAYAQSETVELERVILSPDSPKSDINVALPENTIELIIEIDPGINGPLQDRVVLRAPRLRLERSAYFE